jgi:hypothetical protein
MRAAAIARTVHRVVTLVGAQSSRKRPAHFSIQPNLADVELAKMARPPHSAIQTEHAGQSGESRVQHAVIQPWGIRVQRSLEPSGKAALGPWAAVSDSLFVPFADAHLNADRRYNEINNDINNLSDNLSDAAEADRVHHGLVERLVDVERITEITDARLDAFGSAQAVRFDATALLTAQGAAPCVAWGGWQQQGHEAIACEGVWGLLIEGVLPAEATARATTQAARQLAKRLDTMGFSLACGNVACLIDVGSTGMWWRATQIQAAAVTAPDGLAQLVLALAGSPVLPNAGAWRVTHGMQAEPDVEGNHAIDHPPVAVIRRNAEQVWQIADCHDLFVRTAQAGVAAQPRTSHRPGKLGLAPGSERTPLPAALNQHLTHHHFAMNTGLQELHFVQPQLERLAMKSSGEYGRLTPGHDARIELRHLWSVGSQADTASARRSSRPEVLKTQIHPNQWPSLGIDGLHFETRWKVTAGKPSVLFETGEQRLLWQYDPADHTEAVVRVSCEDWQISLGPLRFELQTADHALLSLTTDRLQSGCLQSAQLTRTRWHWGRGLQAVQAVPAISTLWPYLLDALNGASTGAPWPIAATDTRLYLQHHVCAPRLDFGWGSVQHAQIESGGWTSAHPSQSWFGVTLGTAACPLTLVLPTGVGDAFVQIGVGHQTRAHGLTAPLDSPCPVSAAPARIQVQISCPVDLAFEAGEGPTRDVGSAAARAVIQARDDVPDRLFAEVGGMVHASVLGGMARVAVAMQTTAQVTSNDHDVVLDAGVNVGICLGTAALLDIDFDAEWPWSAALARSA